MILIIPEHWKSKRQIIIETYVVERSPSKVAERLGKDVSYIRKVVKAYKEAIHGLE